MVINIALVPLVNIFILVVIITAVIILIVAIRGNSGTNSGNLAIVARSSSCCGLVSRYAMYHVS